VGGAPDLSLLIAAEPFDSGDARRLVAALDAGLAALYPPEQRFGPNLKPEHLEGGRGAFFVAAARSASWTRPPRR